jgi:hypothetical protein
MMSVQTSIVTSIFALADDDIVLVCDVFDERRGKQGSQPPSDEIRGEFE